MTTTMVANQLVNLMLTPPMQTPHKGTMRRAGNRRVTACQRFGGGDLLRFASRGSAVFGSHVGAGSLAAMSP